MPCMYPHCYNSATKGSMSTFISETIEEYSGLTEAWLACIADTDSVNFHTRPGVKSWSAAECMQHITLTGNQYIGHLSRIIENAQANGPHGDAEYTPGVLGRFILSRTNPPYTVKMKTFPVLTPDKDQYPIDALRSEFLLMKDGLLSLLPRLDGIHIRKKFCPSAITNLLWMPLGLWFRFIAAHERRHLWQAQQAITRVRAVPPAA
jgi:DinB superfamily